MSYIKHFSSIQTFAPVPVLNVFLYFIPFFIIIFLFIFKPYFQLKLIIFFALILIGKGLE